MGAARKKSDQDAVPPRIFASREARQAHMENLALDLIEKRLLNDTATSQETTLFAKSASTRGRIEEERIKADVELSKAKKHFMESQEELQRKFEEAIAAMGSYRMENSDDDYNQPQ